MTSAPPLLNEKFDLALKLAAEWHRPQTRKGTAVPYLAHLLGAASLALEFGATEDEAIAALLHDALEDAPTHTRRPVAEFEAAIEKEFGEGVLAVVRGCTDATPDASGDKGHWGGRKTAYVAHVPTESASVLLVSASDKLHNARAILQGVLTTGDAVFERFRAKKAGTLWYYRALADAYREAETRDEVSAHPGLHALFAEFERTVAALEQASGVTARESRAFDPLAAEG